MALVAAGSGGHGCTRFAGGAGGGGGGAGASVGFVPVAQEVSAKIEIAQSRVRSAHLLQTDAELLGELADGFTVIFSAL